MGMENSVTVDGHDSRKQKEMFKFKTLIIKNQILTTFGVISTTVCWTIFTVTGTRRPQILYWDMFCNCLVIFLMFKSSEGMYKRLCGLCVMACFQKMNPYETEQEMAVIVKQATDYLNGDMSTTTCDSPRSES